MEIYIEKSIDKFDSSMIKVQAQVVKEFPLTLFVNGQELVTIVCSPQNMVELGIGFLVSEGFIREYSEIDEIDLQEQGFLNISLKKELNANGFLRRNFADCCGKGRTGLFFANDARQVKAVETTATFPLNVCQKHMVDLQEKAEVFKLTGGVHSAALGDQNRILFIFDDLGRHNTIDKIIGASLLQGISGTDKCLVLTGRISSEIIIKAARANIPILVSKAAPTDLAVDLAEDLNITVLGFVRKGKANIYSHPERIII